MVYNRDGRVGGVSVNIVIPKPVNEILLVLYENNYDGYLVGGTVRNLVLEQNRFAVVYCRNVDAGFLHGIYESHVILGTGRRPSFVSHLCVELVYQFIYLFSCHSYYILD